MVGWNWNQCIALRMVFDLNKIILPLILKPIMARNKDHTHYNPDFMITVISWLLASITYIRIAAWGWHTTLVVKMHLMLVFSWLTAGLNFRTFQAFPLMTPSPAILDGYQDQGYGLPSNHTKVVGLFYTSKTFEKNFKKLKTKTRMPGFFNRSLNYPPIY